MGEPPGELVADHDPDEVRTADGQVDAGVPDG
jgi:hypothetical protein